jgi:hypothetical protein
MALARESPLFVRQKMCIGEHLIGVYLTGVYLTAVHLMGAYLMGVQLIDVYPTDVYMFPNPKRLWGKPPDPPPYKRWSIWSCEIRVFALRDKRSLSTAVFAPKEALEPSFGDLPATAANELTTNYDGLHRCVICARSRSYFSLATRIDI